MAAKRADPGSLSEPPEDGPEPRLRINPALVLRRIPEGGEEGVLLHLPSPVDPPASGEERSSLPARRYRRWGVVVLSILAIAAIGWVDLQSDPEIGFTVFYLLPILAAAWWAGEQAMVAVSFLAGAAWFVADLSSGPAVSMGIHVWNGMSRLAIYLFVGILIVRIRDRDRRLGELNARLGDLLSTETHLARRDHLTGLPNRRAFREGLWMELTRCRRTGEPLCLAYVDVDNFKQVNDLYGHSVGDRMLQRIAAGIGECIRANDLAARLGGDEFSVLFAAAKSEGPRIVARRIVDLVDRLGRDHTPLAMIGASVGVAYFDRAPEHPDEIIRRADAAMYEAKSGGKGRMALWSGPGPFLDPLPPAAPLEEDAKEPGSGDREPDR